MKQAREAIFIDHSGSVSYDKPFLGKMIRAARLLNPNADLFAFSDTVATLGEAYKVAGGGTDIEVIERFLAGRMPYPSKVTIFTDGDFCWPDESNILYPERWTCFCFPHDGLEDEPEALNQFLLKKVSKPYKTKQLAIDAVHPRIKQMIIGNEVGSVRDFIYSITKASAKSPMAEAEVEEIARCALNGGYKFNVDKFVAAFGRFLLNMPVE